MIINKTDIETVMSDLKSDNKKIVFTNGCFDIIHMGHVDYLNKTKAFGDFLVVGLNSDKSVKRIKGSNRPIVAEEQRAFILDNLKAVDAVVLFDDDTPQRLIESIKPDILAKGADYSIENVIGAKFVLEHGGEVKLVPFLDGYSTSQIIEKIRANYK